MTLVLSTLRSHFFKHLPCTTSTATAFFPFRRIRHLTSPPRPPDYFLSPPPHPQLTTQLRSLTSLATSSSASTTTSTVTPTDESFTSPYLSVNISCRRHAADMLSEALLCFGACSTSIDEQEDNHRNNDDEICITSTFAISQDVKECVSLAADSIGLKETPRFEVEMHDHIDWIKQTQESFHPVKVTEGLWIVPEWKEPLDLQATNIILNPGLAFGTGEHPTTKLCLLLLHRLIKGGESFLDYGTGSGILAIAALKFGAASSVGFDIDPQAITSARHNAALNNIGPEQLLLDLVPSKKNLPLVNENPAEGMSRQHSHPTGVMTETCKYDVVIANILLNPLLDLADAIVSYAKPGAPVGLSGIISEQIPRIIECYSGLLDDIEVTEMDGWACVSGHRKKQKRYP